MNTRLIQFQKQLDKRKDYGDIFVTHIKSLLHWIRHNVFLIGLFSLIWFMLRTGTKPSRAVYPCQRAAASNSYIWLTIYILPSVSAVPRKISANFCKKKLLIIIVLAVIITESTVLGDVYEAREKSPIQVIDLTLTGRVAEVEPSSDIFVVKGTSESDDGVIDLINFMGNHELLFYKSPVVGRNGCPTGLIAKDDVIIIKVNSQWDERGGTNTDLLKALIKAIVNHPDGFTGEIIVADNGQDQYGPALSGGSLDWSRNNAEDISQSAQKVVDSFAGFYNVSTYLWDTITTKRVNEYFEGDMENGYVINETVNPRTGIIVSYPKFRTKFGTYISFKLGIWNNQTQTYDSERLKVINVPVLKSHLTYEVTACVKHYMGVASDKLTRQLGARTHNTIGTGGMGTEMVETRFPILNILDAIWVNAKPLAGPWTPYDKATRVNVIAASTDPVALDYWAAKHILLQAARALGYSGGASMDPDNTASGSFGHWLRLSMQEISRAGYQNTADEAHMNVYVLDFQPPLTTISFSGILGDDGWFTSEVTVTLSATEDSEVDKIEYSFDNISWITYSSSFTITREGRTSIYYKSTGKAGNVEAINSETIKIDKTTPSISITSPFNGSETRSSTVTVAFTGSDEISGIDHYEVRINGFSWINTAVDTAYTFMDVSDGTHTVYVKAVDKAGLSEEVSVTLTVNTSVIGGPGWTDDIIVSVAIAGIAFGLTGVAICSRKTERKA